MFVNRMPRYEPLSEEALATIDRGWERVAREIGVQFDHPRALELFEARRDRRSTATRCGSTRTS